MNLATELRVPPNPAINATKAILSVGPGLPANKLPRVPDKAQAKTLQVKVPIGKFGLQELYLESLHLVSTPRGENSRLKASRRSAGS
mmetsp:Transcript_7782/g.18746  ORF Transcript_7782/g.18746 Transcript_7782/m.18746 type:complete len:87 (-) Transcript_7782:1552-1812(-)